MEKQEYLWKLFLLKIQHQKPPKNFRRLKDLWYTLVSPKNLQVPTTLDDLKQLFVVPKVKIDNTECYFNKKAENRFYQFMQILYNIPVVKTSVSYECAYETVISHVEKTLNERKREGIRLEPEKEITEMIKSIITSCQHYQYIWILDGVELVDIDSLSLGQTEVFRFSKVHEDQLMKYAAGNDLERFEKTVMAFVRKNLAGKVCITSTGFGDRIKGEEISLKNARQGIDILRFIVCLLGHETVHENPVKINLRGESYQESEKSVSVNLTDKSVGWKVGRGKTSIGYLPLDSQIIKDLRQNNFFDDLTSMLSKEVKTELEEATLACIHWISEAQDDFDHASSFIKYWTSLETLFTIEKKDVKESLAKGVATLLAFGGYKFIEIEEIGKVYRSTKSLYDKRSEIIHRGSFSDVRPVELSELCKYAVWCCLTCLGLRSLGYKTLQQIKVQTTRLYNLQIRTSQK